MAEAPVTRYKCDTSCVAAAAAAGSSHSPPLCQCGGEKAELLDSNVGKE